MAVQPGIASGFSATMEDNGNAIPLPPGSTFSWSTDDATDQISVYCNHHRKRSTG